MLSITKMPVGATARWPTLLCLPGSHRWCNACSRDVLSPQTLQPPSHATFGQIWQDHIVPMAGRRVRTQSQNRVNEILEVDNGGLLVTLPPVTQRITIEIFRWTIERLRRGDTVLREEINQQYPGRASSGVLAVLSAIPPFESVAVGRSKGLRMRRAVP